MKMTPELASAYLMHGDEAIQELAKGYLRMYQAMGDLYYAAAWYADRQCNDVALWTNVRDVCGFIPGNAPVPTRLGVSMSELQKNGTTPNEQAE